MKFLKVDTIENARQRLLKQTSDWLLKSEIISLQRSLDRVLSKDIISPENIPSFRRSTVDGYAVIAKDTNAAGEAVPSFLKLIGSVEMGEGTKLKVTSGTCCEVPTGGILPEGADAVVMLEYCESFGDDGITIYKSVGHGENVINVGDDIKIGETLLPQGRLIKPQDVGALALAGQLNVPVYTSPHLSIISTGDELVPPDEFASPGKIRDINSFALSALALKSGFNVVDSIVVPDDESLLTEAVHKSMLSSDIVAISGGSSVGKKDITAKVISKIASDGVNTHGLAIRPGKPTILGYDTPSKTVLAGLPGHPVSAIIIFEMLFGWLIRELSGLEAKPKIAGRLVRNIPASPGKLTCCLCKLVLVGDCYKVEPVFYKSGLITSLTQADGYFLIQKDTEGLKSGQDVLVTLL